MERDKTLEIEKKHLESIIGQIKSESSYLAKRLENIGATNLASLLDLRSDPETGTDFAMLMEQLHEKNEAFNLKDKFKRLEEMKYLQDNPYFARLDYVEENGSTSKIYIGKFGFTKDVPVVTDWRTNIASLYYKYRYPQKNVIYTTPEGEKKVDLKLKRTFDIYKGALVKYFNNDIQFDESDVIVGKISKRTGGVLEDIIETIQKDQMDIIDADPRQVCIVQGCVGSGKSTVAIHKLAHIFFNYPGYIHPERSILIAKNQILIGYLSTLFPKLGIFDISYKTLRDLVVNTIFREEMPIKVDLDIEMDTSAFSLSEIKAFFSKMDSIHEAYKQKISLIFSDPDLENFGGYKYSKSLTPTANIDEIVEDLTEEWEEEKEHIKEDPKSIRSYLYKENIKSIRKAINKLKDLKQTLRNQTFNDVVMNYGIDANSKLSYKQTLIYMLIWAKIIGFKKVIPYEYCVIDEAQDFSVLEYAVIGNFILRGRLGLFGDLNQTLDKAGLETWEHIKEVYPDVTKVVNFKLETNYRSTKPIINLANQILSKFTDKYLPKSVNRNGPDPELLSLRRNDEILNDLKQRIDRDVSNITKSIGIIVDDIELELAVETYLTEKKVEFIKLNEKERVKYVPKGVYLMNIDNCKGLEFSKVYALKLNIDKLEDLSSARRAFVAVTRAMNELVIYKK